MTMYENQISDVFHILHYFIHMHIKANQFKIYFLPMIPVCHNRFCLLIWKEMINVYRHTKKMLTQVLRQCSE